MKNIWIMNHYATNTFFDRGGRHYCLAKHLRRKGYQVTVFCASTVHNTDRSIEIKKGRCREGERDGIPYVFVKTPDYKGNGARRVWNMACFYWSLFPVSRQVCKRHGKPDVILASSVHPLTLVAGIQIGRRMKVPCVCEVRDLWPESIVEFGGVPRKNPAIQLLYRLERWIYRNADALVFTMAGGRRYIRDKGWTRGINPKKIHHVNNGVDLEAFDYNREHFQTQDEDLEREDMFKVVYAGSIREANDIGFLVKAVEGLDSPERCLLLIYGDGPDRERLEGYCREKGLCNVKFKGRVEKRYIPYILSKADLNIMNYGQAGLFQYGGSQNKLFEYLASGKPVCSNVRMGYSLIEKYHCGLEGEVKGSKEYMELIKKIIGMTAQERCIYGCNSRKAAEAYDYRALADRMEIILKNVGGR